MICANPMRPGLHGAPQRGAALLRRSPAEFTSGGRNQIVLGASARQTARGMAGAHIAELIHTMLEKKASGIDLR